jgi:hypothetical protein
MYKGHTVFLDFLTVADKRTVTQNQLHKPEDAEFPTVKLFCFAAYQY